MSKSRSGKVGTVMPAAIASARAQGSPAARAEAHRDGRRSEAAPRPEAARNDRRERWGSGYAGMCPPAGRVTCAGHGSSPANYGGAAPPPPGARRPGAGGGGQSLGPPAARVLFPTAALPPPTKGRAAPAHGPL